MDNENLKSDQWEEFLPVDSEYRRLHRGVRLDPESIWEALRVFLCVTDHRVEEVNRIDLIEDLMFWHAEAFVDRLEALVKECPSVRLAVAWANVGGVAGPGVERFDDLQNRVLDELEAEGVIQRG